MSDRDEEQTDKELSKHVNHLPPRDDYSQDLEQGFIAKKQAQKAAERAPFSLIGFIIFLATIAILGLMGLGIYYSWAPQDISEIDGYNQPENAPDIPALIKKSVQQERSLTLTEADVNRYLAANLTAVQHGPMTILASSPTIGIKFHQGKSTHDGTVPQGYIEIIIVRNIGTDGKQTVSAYITPTQTLGDSQQDIRTKCEFQNDETFFGSIPVGGKIGSLPVPQGYIYFLTPALENLAEATEDLIDLIIDSGLHIQIEEGKIELIPPQRPGV